MFIKNFEMGVNPFKIRLRLKAESIMNDDEMTSKYLEYNG